jgi:uncharacterized protein with von Willebrand factor type A (vWA) domain
MFTDFFYHLREHGLNVSLTEWLTLIRALAEGHAANLDTFYHLARALLVKRESEFDLYDRAFVTFFSGVEDAELREEILRWLADPVLPRALTDEERAALEALDLETLRQRLLERLREQTERHDGGDRWIGTGGTSPFGLGGRHPGGVRMGGAGAGGRSAIRLAGERRFRNLRSDRILDTRQMGLALRRLRRLARDRGPEELDLEATIDRCARNGGEIDLVFAPPRRNRVKLLLLIDVGGSMDPHTELCERLFSAAHALSHFRKFEYRFFHNCVYRRLYTDISRWQGEPTNEVLERLDQTWCLILVGDAWMSPHELCAGGDAGLYFSETTPTGLTWLERFRQRCPRSVWLNPEPRRIWSAPTIRLIRQVFPMYELTLDGLGEAVDVLRGARPNRPLSEIPYRAAVG